jgi:hypothetical protein
MCSRQRCLWFKVRTVVRAFVGGVARVVAASACWSSSCCRVLILSPIVMSKVLPIGEGEIDLFSWTRVAAERCVGGRRRRWVGCQRLGRGHGGLRRRFCWAGMGGFRRRAPGHRVVATRSGDVRIMALGRHGQCQLSDGWRGVDRDEEEIDPLIVGVDDSDHAHIPGPEPVHGDLPAAGELDSARSAVPAAPGQRDPPDRDSLGSEFLDQRAKLDGRIPRAWPPGAVESAPGGTTRFRLRRAKQSPLATLCGST